MWRCTIAIQAGDHALDTARYAGDAARRGAHNAYRMALDNPRTSTAAGVILAAALIGGVLWYIFGTEKKEPRKPRTHARAGAERRKRSKSARAAATA